MDQNANIIDFMNVYKKISNIEERLNKLEQTNKLAQTNEKTHTYPSSLSFRCEKCGFSQIFSHVFSKTYKCYTCGTVKKL
jgi:ribosomal protein S27E